MRDKEIETLKGNIQNIANCDEGIAKQILYRFQMFCRDNGIKRVRTFEGTGYKEDGFTPLIYTEFEEVKLTE
jgi:hypothetical protein